MEVTFWGVRGSITAPGPAFNRYGGNTPCVSVRTRGGTLVILDAGTGITVLGRTLMQTEFSRGAGRATLLLTHAHWDHIQGFPFFVPVHIPGNCFTIYGPSESPAMVEGILEGQMDPHFSPHHSLRNLGAHIDVLATQDGGSFAIDDLRVTARFNPHGGYSALAYRIEHGANSLVYAPDAGYGADLPATTLELYRGASLLVHDCTYAVGEAERLPPRGHSSIADAARVAARCGVKCLAMFHYHQDYTDEQIDELAAQCRTLLDREPGGAAVALIPAAEGLKLEL